MAQATAQQGQTHDRDVQRRGNSDASHPMLDDMVCRARDYAREQPEMAALWCLGIGFVLGWKLKPW
ncbi:MAG TPA: hypothetical protein VM165_00115 [Planctomycetaceae bacterium]|nr:hypothetical protein [Planctomycetaceae bacterium]